MQTKRIPLFGAAYSDMSSGIGEKSCMRTILHNTANSSILLGIVYPYCSFLVDLALYHVASASTFFSKILRHKLKHQPLGSV